MARIRAIFHLKKGGESLILSNVVIKNGGFRLKLKNVLNGLVAWLYSCMLLTCLDMLALQIGAPHTEHGSFGSLFTIFTLLFPHALSWFVRLLLVLKILSQFLQSNVFVDLWCIFS